MALSLPFEQRRWWLALAGGASLSLSSLLFSPSAAEAQNDFDAGRFAGFLNAGEFAPAERMASGISNGEMRDQQFAALAAAQARVGALRQADRTAAMIRSDEVFNGAMAQRSGSDAGFLSDSSDPGSGSPMGSSGGGIQADFDPLIELITRTVAPESWEELGGTGRIQEFEAGVHVDPAGRLQRVLSEDGAGSLRYLRDDSLSRSTNSDERRESTLRKVSLTRLERAVRARLERGQEPTEAMLNLAGLRRIDALLVYPETGDLVLVGPAGDWKADREGRNVHTETGMPILQMDDFVACLRAIREGSGTLGCSIDPKPENLLATQEYLAAGPAEGKRWREGLRAALGTQVITIKGLDPTSHAAQTIVAADYHMKLVGMGLEPGVHGVDDVLTLMAAEPERPRETSVIRWWFSLNYDRVLATEEHDAFRLEGNAVQVLSENEKLEADGERVHTGTSDEPTRGFAHAFTENYDGLSQKYAVYADMRNVFDLAMVCGLIDKFDLDTQVGWRRGCFSGSPDAAHQLYATEPFAVPTEVETVMNIKEIQRRAGGRTIRETLMGVSGGVRADIAGHLTSLEVETDNYGDLSGRRDAAAPETWDSAAWWWD